MKTILEENSKEGEQLFSNDTSGKITLRDRLTVVYQGVQLE